MASPPVVPPSPYSTALSQKLSWSIPTTHLCPNPGSDFPKAILVHPWSPQRCRGSPYPTLHAPMRSREAWWLQTITKGPCSCSCSEPHTRILMP